MVLKKILEYGMANTAHMAGAESVPQPNDHLYLFDVQEAAPWLRMGVPTLYRDIASGAIPREFYTKRSRRIFFTGAQIHALIAYWAKDHPAAKVPTPRNRAEARAAAKAAR